MIDASLKTSTTPNACIARGDDGMNKRYTACHIYIPKTMPLSQHHEGDN